MDIDLKVYKALVDDAFRNTALNVRQNKAAAILSEAHKHLSRKKFKELKDYVYEAGEVTCSSGCGMVATENNVTTRPIAWSAGLNYAFSS